MNDITEGVHYYVNEDGYVVLTEQYHLDRGYCCGNGCLHCPFEYDAVPEPRRNTLRIAQQNQNSKDNENNA
mgnify:CR=1 FL=1